MKRKIGLIITLLCATSFAGINAALAAPLPLVQWDAEIEAPPIVTDLAGRAGGEMSNALAEITTALRPLGAKASLAEGKLRLAGQQSLDQLRTTLFDEESGQINFLGGPVALNLTLPANHQPGAVKAGANLFIG